MSENLMEKIKEVIDNLGLNEDLTDIEQRIKDIIAASNSGETGKVNLIDPAVIALLLNKNFGLREIKKEIKEIEKKLDDHKDHDKKDSCEEIKREIKDIKDKLDDKHSGLSEIKKEIKDIEGKLDDPHTGLAEIKREVHDIEGKLDHPNTGLAEIKREVHDIEGKLDNQHSDDDQNSGDNQH